MTQQENTTSKNNNGWAFVMIVVLVVIIYAWCTGRKERVKEEAQNPAERCLSDWDGSHKGLVDATKALMNDPGSFNHVETRYSYTPGGNEVFLTMTFRGKNGFGGTVTQTVTGTIDRDCNLTKGPTLVKI